MQDSITWIPIGHTAVAVRGLPWHAENGPDLWRLPRQAIERVPEGVRRQARFPAGGRICLCCDTSQLVLRAVSRSEAVGQCVDLYVDGAFWRSLAIGEAEEASATCFRGCCREQRDITLYLPYRQEVQVVALGMDRDATFGAPSPFRHDRPMVLYGSSIAQGVGASRPGMAYAAILARSLNLDFVNLGFGGAGKAEPEVVEYVSAIDACCLLLDLGKSYGRQPAAPFAAMLDRYRAAHADVPIVCITPVFSTRELYDPEYVELSRHVREVMRRAVEQRVRGGDANLAVIEGLDLLGRDDSDAFSRDGVHPSDLGHARIAERLMRAVPSWARGRSNET